MIPSDFQRYVRSNEFKDLLTKVQGAMERGDGEYFDVDDLVDVAEYYHVKGQPDRALKVIDYLLYLFPGNDKGLVFKGRQAIMQGDIDEAERIASEMEITDLPDTIYLKAEVMLCRGDAEKAEELLQENRPEIAEPKDSPDIDTEADGSGVWNDDDGEDEEQPSDRFNDYVLDVALLMCDYRQWDRADKWLGMLTDDTYEDEVDYLEVKARILTAREEFDEAIRYWDKCIDVDSFSLLAWLQLSQCQYHQGLMREALQSAEYAEAIAPNTPEVYLAEGNCYFALGDNEKSLKKFEKFLELCPFDVQGEVLTAGVLFAMEDYDEAYFHITNAIFSLESEHNDGDDSVPEKVRIEIYRQAAYICAAQGREGEAMFYADRLEMCSIRETEILLLRGGIKLELGDSKGSFEYFTKCLEKTHHDPETYIRIGCMMVDASLYQVGYQVLSETYKILGDSGIEMRSGLERLAYAALKTDRYEMFLDVLPKAIETNPSDTMTIFVDMFPENLPMKEWVEFAKKNPIKP